MVEDKVIQLVGRNDRVLERRVLACVAVILLGGQLWQSNQRELHGASLAGGRAFGRGLLGQTLEVLDLAKGHHPNEFRK